MIETTRLPFAATLGICLLLVLASGVAAWGQAAPASTEQADIVALDPDARLAQRLSDIFANIKGLDEVEVKVDAGVATLSGPVLGIDLEARAIAIAEKLPDVIAVETDIEIERNIRRRLLPVLEDLKDRLLGWAAALPILAIGVIVALFFWWLGRFLAAHEGLTRRWAPNPFVADFLKMILRGAIFVFGLVLALEIVGASAFLGSILGALGLVGLALGIAVRDTVENFIASLLLSVRQPFAPQDHVRIDAHEGRVVRLTSRATILLNFEGNHVRIPNAMVYKGIIVNFTRNPNRRFDFEVGITTVGDPAVAQGVAIEALQSIPGVLESPGPACAVSRLADSNVVLQVLGWVDQTQSAFAKTRSAAVGAVKRAFEQRGIQMPEPIYNINLSHTDAPTTAAAPPDAPAARVDLEPDHDLERQAELYGAGQDLLDAKAPQE